MQRKFQQSKVFQFIDRLVVPVVTETDTLSAFSKTVKTPLVLFLDWLSTPGVQRQVHMAQTVQKTVELPQVQLLRFWWRSRVENSCLGCKNGFSSTSCFGLLTSARQAMRKS